MLWTILAVAALLPSDAPPADRLLVLPGPHAPADVPTLVRSVDWYGDFGNLAVAEGSVDELRKLATLGHAVVDLGAWPDGHALLVQPAARALTAHARLLYVHDDQALLAVPEADVEDLAHAGCHAHEFALVDRRPWTPSAFQAPAVDTLGADAHDGATYAAVAAVAVDDRITPLVAQVDGDNILATVTQLSSYFTRRADSAQILTAQSWLQNQLATIPGLSVSVDDWSGTYAPNIVAELTGTTHPERVVVLGAHLDSINGAGSSATAPGADDNASGSGGLLEAARVLAQGEFANTIRFVWFSAEEFGLLGADSYAADLLGEGVEPVGMLNMDMIAHRDNGDARDLDLATNSTDPTLTQFAIDVTAAYVPSLPVVTGVLTAGSSDHAAFQGQGIPAAFFFEDLSNYSTLIHTANDTLAAGSANDFTLAERITQAFVATAGELAQPVDMTLSHAPLADTGDAGGPYLLQVDASSLTTADVSGVAAVWRVDGGAWTTTPLLADVTPDSWVGSLPGVAPSGLVDYYLLASDSDGHLEWLPDGLSPGAESWTFSVGAVTELFADDFEAPGDNGWTHVQVATQDDWQHDAPQGKGGDPGAAYSGSRVWGNDLGPSGFNGLYQPNVTNSLESPLLDMSGQSDVHLRFRRWLTVEDGLYDQARVFVDGVQVWQNEATPGGSAHTLDSSWQLQDLDVSAVADGNPSFRLRFQLDSDGGAEYGGWNLDDVRLVSVGPGAVGPLVASGAHLSAAAGGLVDFDLDGGAGLAGRTYVMAVGFTGTTPGVDIGFAHIPLNFDPLTDLFFGLLGTPALPGWVGLLSPQGTAQASLFIPPADPSLAGVTLSLAWFTLGPIDFASNAVDVQLLP